jgi:hypothetical protein
VELREESRLLIDADEGRNGHGAPVHVEVEMLVMVESEASAIGSLVPVRVSRMP